MTGKTRFWCKDCKQEFYITIQPNCCPCCGSTKLHKGTAKSYNTAQKYIAECNEIIPIMNEKYAEISKLYTRYATIHETLRAYASRGIIDKKDVPDFHPANLTEDFYASRKCGVKYND